MPIELYHLFIIRFSTSKESYVLVLILIFKSARFNHEHFENLICLLFFRLLSLLETLVIVKAVQQLTPMSGRPLPPIYSLKLGRDWGRDATLLKVTQCGSFSAYCSHKICRQMLHTS